MRLIVIYVYELNEEMTNRIRLLSSPGTYEGKGYIVTNVAKCDEINLGDIPVDKDIEGYATAELLVDALHRLNEPNLFTVFWRIITEIDGKYTIFSAQDIGFALNIVDDFGYSKENKISFNENFKAINKLYSVNFGCLSCTVANLIHTFDESSVRYVRFGDEMYFNDSSRLQHTFSNCNKLKEIYLKNKFKGSLECTFFNTKYALRKQIETVEFKGADKLNIIEFCNKDLCNLPKNIDIEIDTDNLKIRKLLVNVKTDDIRISLNSSNFDLERVLDKVQAETLSLEINYSGNDKRLKLYNILNNVEFKSVQIKINSINTVDIDIHNLFSGNSDAERIEIQCNENVTLDNSCGLQTIGSALHNDEIEFICNKNAKQYIDWMLNSVENGKQLDYSKTHAVTKLDTGLYNYKPTDWK